MSHPGHPGSGDRVDESAACRTDQFDSFIGACWSDKKDQIDVCLAHCGATVGGFFGHKISTEDSIDTRALQLISQPVQADRQKWIEITKQHDRDVALFANPADEFQKITHA